MAIVMAIATAITPSLALLAMTKGWRRRFGGPCSWPDQVGDCGLRSRTITRVPGRGGGRPQLSMLTCASC